MNETITIVLMCMIFMLAVFCVLSCLMVMTKKNELQMEKAIKEYEINVNAAIDQKIPEILDIFVKNVFDDYLVMHMDVVNKDYINQEEETNIIRELGSICSDRISPAMVDKLSLFWSTDSIGSVIAEKVYLQVVAYVASHNTVYTESVTKDKK